MKIQRSHSEQENSDSDRQPIISPETLEEEVDSEKPTDPEPQTSSFKVPKEKIILHNGREHVILPTLVPVTSSTGVTGPSLAQSGDIVMT